MKNFATHFWTQFESSKEQLAFVDEAGETETYWVWTRRVQNIAIGLRDRGFEPGTRLALVTRNRQQWFDLAFATWLAGGCLIPIAPSLERTQILKRCARGGADWIVVDDRKNYELLLGDGTKLPPHLQWVTIEDTELKSESVVSHAEIIKQGRFRAKRGDLNTLAKATFSLEPKALGLVLFGDEESESDLAGALFSNGKLAVMMSYLAADLALDPNEVVLIQRSYASAVGLFPAVATLLASATIAAPTDVSAADLPLEKLKPETLFCGPGYLESMTEHWRELLQKYDTSETTSSFKSLYDLVEPKVRDSTVYKPMRKKLGGTLDRVYLTDGVDKSGGRDVLQDAGIDVLGYWARREFGVSHVERRAAAMFGTVGRPVQGYACKIDGAKNEEAGQICIRTDVRCDGYLNDVEGPCVFGEHWILCPDIGSQTSGFLKLQSE